jgi:hypothetical protein
LFIRNYYYYYCYYFYYYQFIIFTKICKLLCWIILIQNTWIRNVLFLKVASYVLNFLPGCKTCGD